MASGAERLEAGDSEQDEEEDVYEVEKIIDMRVEEVSWERGMLASRLGTSVRDASLLAS